MKIFVYEWVCGGGYLGRSDSPPHSLYDEASAMLAAVLADLDKLDKVEATTLIQPEFARPASANGITVITPESRDQAFCELTISSDATLLVAPEFEGTLLSIATRIETLGGTLLSPSSQFIEITSDKQSTCERLFEAGVPIPRGQVVMAGENISAGSPLPAVLKPIDGCGSLGISIIEQPGIIPKDSAAYRMEKLHIGQPASVTVICHNENLVVLEPCTQIIATDGSFEYQGGQLPLPGHLSERARRLAEKAIRALPQTSGMVGVDMILGEIADGTDDVVVEVNPRLTTSYVGLRAATQENLLGLLLNLVSDQQLATPRFEGSVSWTPDGTINRL